MSNASYAPNFPSPAFGRLTPARRPARHAGRSSEAPSIAVQAGRLALFLARLLHLYAVARFAAPIGPAARAAFVRRWAQRMLRPLCVQVQARGHMPAAGSPVLLVANHTSWLDSYVLNQLSSARFVAKSEVRSWPCVGTVAARCGTFFLRRGSCRAAARMVGELDAVLSAGQPVAVFPEGTTSYGDAVLPFYPAMFQAAVRSGAVVQPVAIRYRDQRGRASRAAAYVGDMSIAESLGCLLREPRLTVEVIFCAPLDPAGRTRRELAALAHAAISAALAGGDLLRRPATQRAA